MSLWKAGGLIGEAVLLGQAVEMGSFSEGRCSLVAKGEGLKRCFSANIQGKFQ